VRALLKLSSSQSGITQRPVLQTKDPRAGRGSYKTELASREGHAREKNTNLQFAICY